MKKLYVFLRHNNDIDHITPVLWKWLNIYDIPVELYITTDKKLLFDYRINMLRQFKNIHIHHLNSWYLYLYKKYYSPMDKYTYRYSWFYNKVNNHIKHLADKIYKSEGGVVCFDWVYNHMVNCMVGNAKKHNYNTVSLPHGDAPYINQLETIDCLDYKFYDNYKKLGVFDYILVPNWLVKRRYRDVGDGRVKMLGSSRYCDEWMNCYDEHIQCYHNKHTGFRIALFLRNLCYPVDWDELGRTLRMILRNIPGCYIIVKGHSRSRSSDPVWYRLLNVFPEFKKERRLCFVGGNINPSSLIRWCDVLLDLGTSSCWEAVKKHVPVLCLDYLHSNRSTLGYYMDNSLMDCRDKLLNTLVRLSFDVSGFYNMDAQGTFLREIVDYPDKDVLGRYVSFLKEMF